MECLKEQKKKSVWKKSESDGPLEGNQWIKKKNEQQKEKLPIITRSSIHSCHTIFVIICLKK